MNFEKFSDKALTTETILTVAQLLGREPRGLEAIEIIDEAGQPSVIRVSSLVDGKPFPTMFWLVDEKLCYELDKLEASGIIAEIQGMIDQSEDLKSKLFDDHISHITLREKNMSLEVKQCLIKRNFFDQLQKRGIGGISNFSRVRCLHTYYASHLVNPNVIGRIVDERYL